MQSNGLEGQTLGAFTKCYNVSLRDLASLLLLVGKAPDAALDLG
jgi:hypothetical protein